MHLILSPAPCKPTPSRSLTAVPILPSTVISKKNIDKCSKLYKVMKKAWIILEKAKDAAPILLKKVKETALTIAKKVKEMAVILLALFMLVIPWIMLCLLAGALPQACTCRSVKLPKCPVARSEEPLCNLMDIGGILWIIFTCGAVFFWCREKEKTKTLTPEKIKKVGKQGKQTETTTNEIV